MTAPLDTRAARLAKIEEPYLVWSRQHDGWWGPNRGGYYSNALNAGVYTREEADGIARKSETPSHGDRLPDRAVPLSEVLSGEAPTGTVAAYLRDRVASLAAQLAAARVDVARLDFAQENGLCVSLTHASMSYEDDNWCARSYFDGRYDLGISLRDAIDAARARAAPRDGEGEPR